MICRGKACDKASFLAGMVNLDYDEPVHYEHERMKRALHMLIYFSAVLPNKFLCFHQDDQVFFDIMGFKSKAFRGKRKKMIEKLDTRHM